MYCISIGSMKAYANLYVRTQTEMDPDTGAPKDELHPETVSWLKTLGLGYTKLQEILAAGPCPKVK